MPKIVFERLKVKEKKQVLAGINSTAEPAEPVALPNPLNPCYKTLDHHCLGLTIIECAPDQPTSGSTGSTGSTGL
jgi:hypothetical protein